MRVLRLSFLAPDLIEAILKGQQPSDLTLEPFRQQISLEWKAQRKFFGGTVFGERATRENEEIERVKPDDVSLGAIERCGVAPPQFPPEKTAERM